MALERSVDRSVLAPCMLRRQYRMQAQIAAFPFWKWYGSQLATARPSLQRDPIAEIILLTGSAEQSDGNSWHNPKGGNLILSQGQLKFNQE